MVISTELSSAETFVGKEKGVELIAKAGFDCFDFSMFDANAGDDFGPKSRDVVLKNAELMRKTGEKFGIYCNQSHAPFPVQIESLYRFLPVSIEATAIAGGKICVIHPNNNKTPEENAIMYKELMPIAHKFGVKIATENMWNWNNEKDRAAEAACSFPENFVQHVDVVGDDFMGACVDIGHGAMFDGLVPEDLIYALKQRVIALHIHDNDCWHDSHEVPFTMKIDFAPICKALKDIGYKGEITLECGTTLAATKDEDAKLRQLVKMREAAEKFRDMMR